MMTRKSLAILPFSITFLLAWTGPSAAFLVQYDYYCYATHSDGVPLAGDEVLTGETHVAGDYVKTGEYGNYGAATFRADIATGTISASAHSHGVQSGPYSFPSGTGRVEQCRFQDRLDFTVPAGSYPDGVEVSIHGHACGSLTSEVGAGAKGRCWARFGGSTFDTGLLEVGVEESGTIVVDEPFVLVVELVAPGTDLAETSVYDLLIDLGFTGGRTWSTAFNPGGGSVIGDGDVSFPDGLRLIALTVPPGVTWASESGVFPELPTGVDDDATASARVRMLGNYPNPFNPTTTIWYALPVTGHVRVQVVDLRGRLIATLVDRSLTAGRHEVPWNGRDDHGMAMPSGVYLSRLETGGRVMRGRMVLAR